jgi:lipoprotein-anchoring transpeptidase ErfK/SrfK
VADAATPRSAYSLPSFEIRARSRPIRLTGADLGARRTSHGISIDEAVLHRTIGRLAAAFHVPGVADAYTLEAGHVVLRAGRTGLELDRAATRALLMRVIHGSTSNLTMPVRQSPVPPAPQDAIVVNLSRFRLELYRRTQLVDRFDVGVGRLSFPTPPGAYYVRWKERNPAWYNPGSSWARDMPAYMPPGPRNPLGSRALRLDRGSLVIHGTPEPWTVGYRSSHGCMRMRRGDIERLFDLVPQGTPVFIIP